MDITKLIVAANDLANLVNLIKNAVHPGKTALEVTHIFNYAENILKMAIPHNESEHELIERMP